ncbi:hypothetical protein RRG08_017740 [Elysia crispata]|uniref:Uncharacterized protein n=1 Tax=Elysia crispata TaxID=231223 RepID=A0AAE0XR09_9GAST|nr:hypothetical protein RRG08_017740 [Elysia crispata]
MKRLVQPLLRRLFTSSRNPPWYLKRPVHRTRCLPYVLTMAFKLGSFRDERFVKINKYDNAESVGPGPRLSITRWLSCIVIKCFMPTRYAWPSVYSTYSHNFSGYKTVRTLIGLFIAAICLRAPQLYGLRHIWKLNPATNNTFLSCAEARDFPIFGKINDIVNRNILSTVAYVAVAVCVVTMVVKLRDASRFSLKATNLRKGKGRDIGSDIASDTRKSQTRTNLRHAKCNRSVCS